LIGTHKDIPEEQVPTPAVAAYNESFDTSFRGELLSAGGQVVGTDGGSPKFSVLWRSPKFVSEIGGDASKKILRLTDKTIVASEQHTSSLEKSLRISDFAVQGPMKMFDSKGLFTVFTFIFCNYFCLPY
jgi:hypothetical protein